MKSLTIEAPDELFAQAVTAMCGNYSYQATVPDPNKPGQTIPNPVLPEDFAKFQLLRFIRENIEAYGVRQANVAVDAARAKIKSDLDAAAGSIVAEVK